jgi:co-chaperonin GroES (HSP10)
MKAGVNKVLIKIGKTVQDQIVTQSGVVLYKDFSFDENWHRTTFGEVIGVPAGANSLLTLGSYKHSELKYDIRIGDIVHFNYIANNKDEKDNVFIIGDDFVYQLVIDQVFAVEREGQIIPQGNKVLLEKYYETILESQFLIIPDGKKEIKSQGIVKFTSAGSAFNVGDRVVFEKPPMNIEINGVLYLVIYEEDVICLL